MNEAVFVKMIIGCFLTLAFGLNAKILWDWLLNRNKKINYKECSATVEDVEHLKDNITVINDCLSNVRQKLEEISNKLEHLSKIIIGNGTIDKSLVYRIAYLEETVKEIKEKIRQDKNI